MTQRTMAGLVLLLALGTAAPALALTLSSLDVKEGAVLATAQLHKDCGGADLSPALSWSGAPAGTKSFAVTVYDPDAQGGWWHWIVYDLPPQTTALPRDGALPAGARPGENDYGDQRYDGACPPPGSGVHHYRFTVWALPSDSLSLDGVPKGATIGPYLTAHALASATLTATYQR